MRWLFPIILLLILTLAGCTQTSSTTETAVSPIPTETLSSPTTTEKPNATANAEPSPESSVLSVSDFEIELVAKVLRGECYDDQSDDKREVVKVICNRVSVGGFGDSIEAVITKPKQFVGYSPDNEPTENDFAIALEVLTQWYKNGCQPMSEYLFFSSGSGHKNVFRKAWEVSP